MVCLSIFENIKRNLSTDTASASVMNHQFIIFTTLSSGVRKTDIGQPPPPVSACTKDMYTLSTSGLSSRSTFTFTKFAFIIAATCGAEAECE